VTGAIGIGAVSLASQNILGASKDSNSEELSPQGTNFGMVIDVGACVGCRECAYGCMAENNIGRDSNFRWIQVYEMDVGKFCMDCGDPYYEEAPKEDKWYLPTQCMQCENPPCVSACPVGATWKDPDGIIAIDYDMCIGCKYCMTACPYWARYFNWKDPEVPSEEITPEGGTYGLPFSTFPIRPAGVVEKCTFCAHRTRKGLDPKCVESCPMGARHFGDLNDPDSEVSKLIRTRRQAFRLKDWLGTEPKIYYVL
jgi:molybdopterin-containing oxidoreductase family iron-sulfur binding subunit